MNPSEEMNRTNIVEWSVAALSLALKRTLETSYDQVRVRGELGRVSRPGSGHIYLDLKDDKAVLSGVIWRSAAGSLQIQPEPGLEVVVTGRITTYPGQSRYQIVVERMEPAGIGALMALLQKRRAVLEAEGLFAPERKAALPYLPRVIGVVTSPSGAVIRDILHRLADRFPRHVIVWPVRVQGKTCGVEVAAAIRGFNSLAPSGRSGHGVSGESPAKIVPRPDVIIVARGGGSIEDLWGFNDEDAVRAAAKGTIPLISAIGHETDWTLMDYVADERAPTPTAAAERVVPVRGELVTAVLDLAARQHRSLVRLFEERRLRLRSAMRVLRRPEDRLELARQRFDIASGGLDRALRANIRHHHTRLVQIMSRLAPGTPLAAIRRQHERTHVAGRSLERGMGRRLDDLKRRISAQARLMESLSYRAVLNRGFALVRNHRGNPVGRAAQLGADGRVGIEFHDGRVRAQIIRSRRAVRSCDHDDLNISGKARERLL